MKKFLLVLFSIIIHQNIFSQFAFNYAPFKLNNPPESSYKIIQYSGKEVTRIAEVDKKGRTFFEYKQGDIPPFFNWKEPHIFISAYEYDKDGNVTKEYSFNSNAGHNIYTYEFAKDKSTKTLFTQSYIELKEVEINTNAYSNISRIKNFKQLRESSEVINIIGSPKTQGIVEFLDNENKPIRIKEYIEIYGDTIITTIDYDATEKELNQKVFVISNMELQKEILNEYPNEYSKITRIINYRNGEKSTIYQFAETKNKANKTETEYSESNGILTIRHNMFDDYGHLIKIIVYQTDFKGNLIVPISNDFTKTAEMQYSYNKEGLVKKEKMIDYETDKMESRKYQYRIEIE